MYMDYDSGLEPRQHFQKQISNIATVLGDVRRVDEQDVSRLQLVENVVADLLDRFGNKRNARRQLARQVGRGKRVDTDKPCIAVLCGGGRGHKSGETASHFEIKFGLPRRTMQCSTNGSTPSNIPFSR